MSVSKLALCLVIVLLASGLSFCGEADTPAPQDTTDDEAATVDSSTEDSDETLGETIQAAKEKIIEGSLFSVIKKGGVMMWFLAAASVIGLAIAFERLFGLRQGRVVPRKLFPRVKDALQREGARAASASCGSGKSPLSRVLKAGLECFGALEPTGVSAAEIESAMGEAMSDVASQELWRLRNPTKRLGFIASVAPLMGLLGTVIGMIKLFDVIGAQGAVGDVKALSGGIAEALLSTAAGLAIALPLLFMYEHFRSKAERNIHTISELANDLTRTAIGRVNSKHTPERERPMETAGATRD